MTRRPRSLASLASIPALASLAALPARLGLRRAVLAALLLSTSMGHSGGGGCCGGEGVLGPPTGATCPQGSTLTYDTFGRAFMEAYCTRCHDSALTGEARMGATAFHDFDTLVGIRRVASHIDETSGSGPDATNDSMPPDGPMPSLAERERLAEWLACGAP